MSHDKSAKKSAKAHSKAVKKGSKALQGLNAVGKDAPPSPKDKAQLNRSPILGLKHAIEAAQVADMAAQVAALGGN